MTGSIHWPTAVLVAGTMLLLWLAAWLLRRSRRRGFLSEVDRATYATLHTASLASQYLGDGLTPDAAEKAGRHLLSILGAHAVSIADPGSVLSWTGLGDHHRGTALALGEQTRETGRTVVHASATWPAPTPTARSAAPSRPRSSWTTSSSAPSPPGPTDPSPGLARATEEVAAWVSSQLELAELDRSRTRLMEAEVRALRAQISPHFIYNSPRARSRRSCAPTPTGPASCCSSSPTSPATPSAASGEFTTLAEELRNVERYLVLEQARFGDRLQVTLLIAPEVLPVAVPFLRVQPLVENAVRHGLASKEGVGHITITASDRGSDAEICIEDDGVGADPERVRPILAGAHASDSVGLGNVDARLRQRLRRRVRPRRRDRAGRRHEGDRSACPSSHPASTPRRSRGRRLAPMSTNDVGLTALVVDDERPALDDLGYLLGRDDRIAEVITASSGTEALQVLQAATSTSSSSTSRCPGSTGLDLARVLSRFSVRPQIVFVTAHDEHAVDAFELRAIDYVMKPVRAERLAEAVRRVVVAQTEKPPGCRPRPASPRLPSRGRDDPGRAAAA